MKMSDNQNKSECWLFEDAQIVVHCKRKMPNIWIRFWHRILLGWTWHKEGEYIKFSKANSIISCFNIEQ